MEKTTKKILKKATCLLLVILTITTMILPASAASTSWPDISQSHYLEMKAPTKVLCYKDSGLTTRGTCSPNKGYNSYIDPGDLLFVYSITPTYTKLSFPTSSGRRTAFVSTKALFGVSSPVQTATATTAVKTYVDAGLSTKSGSVYANEQVWRAGSAGNAVLVLYPAPSGNRSYKAAFISSAIFSARFTSSGNTPSAGASVSARQQAMADAALSMLGSTKYNGYCQRFVRVAGQSIGLPAGNAASALAACDMWRVSTSMDNIPVGAAVYLRSKNHSSAGYTYGHVAIYIGRGMVVHAQSTVKVQSLTDLLSSYTYLGWGWQAGVSLT